MADQTAQQSRPPSNAYPSPHSYPSPSMQPTYAYPPPQGQSAQEPYRGSPQGQNMSLPPLNLPPIRLQDGQQAPPAQPQAQPAGQPPMASPLPPPQHGMPPQYYGHPPPGQQMAMNSAPHLQMRYAITPQADNRMMSGGRHKKEIKRRTKTGCLTCRKRRIKCDEAHPVCRNCQKSKRECLGYDPIFKQQPGPAQIQPAPNSTPHQPPVPASSPPGGVLASYAAQVPQGYAPAVTAGYAPAVSASGPNHQQPQQPYNAPAIDPALAGADSSMHSGQPAYNGAHPMNAAMGSQSPYPAPSEQPIKAKRLNIADIFPIGNHQPPEVPQRHGPIPRELDDEFAEVFAKDYCQGLDAVLETTWFSTNNNALNRILADQSLHEEAIHFVETIKYKQAPADMAGIFGQEARLIWHMLGVCKHSPPATNGTNGAIKAEDDDLTLKEVRARFEILEALLTNQVPQTNPLHAIQYPPEVMQYKKPELDFWNEMGNFVVHADTESPSPGPADFALGTMRTVLQAQETRDALYSIAIARRIGNRLGGFPSAIPPPPDNNPENDINKLNVAMNFISYEARSGTQQIITRICDMAMLSWTVSRR